MKQHLPIILAIALPVVFILGVFVFGTGKFFKEPVENDFLFSAQGSAQEVRYKYVYEFNDDKLTLVPRYPSDKGGFYDEYGNYIEATDEVPDPDFAPNLYVYSAKEDLVSQISYADAAKLELIGGPSSPEGFYVEPYHYSSNDFLYLFGSSRSDGPVIVKNGQVVREIGFPNNNYYWYGDFTFVSWIDN
jgi:hypothetical protein